MAERQFDPTKDPHLASWNERKRMGIKRMRCPSCQREGYKPYIYPDGEMVAEECGRCDHETGCGYHVTPKEWFKEHKQEGDHTNPNYSPPEPPPSIKVPSQMVHDVYCLNPNAVHNPLLSHWKGIFQGVKPEHQDTATKYMQRFLEALRTFAVGSMPGSYTVWWITDETGWIRSGKAMMYLPDGHRDKQSPNNFRWMHNLARLTDPTIPEDAEYVGCLFGQHQLRNKPVEVCIVESEKTAVLMSVFKPQMTWMATMGIANLNQYRLAPLLDRKISIRCFPDVDGIDRWRERIALIKADRPDAKIVLDPYIGKRLAITGKEDILDFMERDYIMLYS